MQAVHQSTGGMQGTLGGEGNGGGGEGTTDDANDDTLWVQLSVFHDKGYLLGASSSEQASVGQNLVPAHAYSIKHVWAPAARVRLLCLSNPTGRDTWTGAWCEGAPEWEERPRHVETNPFRAPPPTAHAPPRIVRAAAPDGGHAKPGDFWISFEDFRKNFAVVDVCKVSQDWDSVRLDGMFPLNPSGMQIIVLHDTSMHVCMCERDTNTTPNLKIMPYPLFYSF